AAQKLQPDSANSLEQNAPMRLQELGWWFYMAGDYRSAADLLGQAIQQRPRDLRLGARLSWADIELRRFSDALQVLKLEYEQGQAQPERTMARAVSLWRALQYDEALRGFCRTTKVGVKPGNKSTSRNLAGRDKVARL